jgi:hypothetical protein
LFGFLLDYHEIILKQQCFSPKSPKPWVILPSPYDAFFALAFAWLSCLGLCLAFHLLGFVALVFTPLSRQNFFPGPPHFPPFPPFPQHFRQSPNFSNKFPKFTKNSPQIPREGFF